MQYTLTTMDSKNLAEQLQTNLCQGFISQTKHCWVTLETFSLVIVSMCLPIPAETMCPRGQQERAYRGKSVGMWFSVSLRQLCQKCEERQRGESELKKKSARGPQHASGAHRSMA